MSSIAQSLVRIADQLKGMKFCTISDMEGQDCESTRAAHALGAELAALVQVLNGGTPETERPQCIYLIEERRGPTKDGPWSPWTYLAPPNILGRFPTCLTKWSEQQCKPRCVAIGSFGPDGQTGEIWVEHRLVPYSKPSEAPAVIASFATSEALDADERAGIREFMMATNSGQRPGETPEEFRVRVRAWAAIRARAASDKGVIPGGALDRVARFLYDRDMARELANWPPDSLCLSWDSVQKITAEPYIEVAQRLLVAIDDQTA